MGDPANPLRRSYFHQEKTLLHQTAELKGGALGVDSRGGEGDLWERKGEARGICGYFLALGITSSIGKSTGCSHCGLLSASCEFPTAPAGFPARSCLPETFSQGDDYQEQERSGCGNREVCPDGKLPQPRCLLLPTGNHPTPAGREGSWTPPS